MKFCPQCGAHVEDTGAFCPSCGARLDGAAVDATQADATRQVDGTLDYGDAGFPQSQAPTDPMMYGTQPPASYAAQQPAVVIVPTPATAPAQQQPERKRGPAVAIGVVAGVLLGVGAAALVTFGVLGNGTGDKGSSDSASSSQVAVSSVASEQGAKAPAAATGSSASSAPAAQEAQSAPAPEPTPEPEAPAASSRIDLADPAQYQDINVYLSNFSEANLPSASSMSAYRPRDIIDFVIDHEIYNNPGNIQNKDASWPKASPDGLEHSRIPASRVDELSNRYFGRSSNMEAATYGANCGTGWYYDGYIYYVQRTKLYPGGVSLATSAVDQSDGTVRVDFDVYQTVNGYDTVDQGLYACSPAELMARFGASGPSGSGTAIIAFGGGDQYTGGKVLVSYQRSGNLNPDGSTS